MEMQQHRHKMKRATVFTVVVMAMLLGAGLFFVKTGNDHTEMNAGLDMKNKITGLGADAGIRVQLLQPDQPPRHLLVHKNRPGDFKIETGLLESSYRLSFRLSGSTVDIRDVVIDVNQKRGLARIILAGYEPRLPVSLTHDGHIVEDRVPADWAGRLEFNLSVPDEEVPSLLCLNWPESGGTGPASLCHVAGGKEAV